MDLSKVFRLLNQERIVFLLTLLLFAAVVACPHLVVRFDC